MRSVLSRWMPWVLLVGGVAWMAKVGVIVATDGDVTDTGAAGLLYVIGVVGLALGSTSIAGRAVGGRGTLALVGASLLCVVAFLVSYVAVIDPLAKATLDELGGSYMRDEHGIWLTGLAWAIVAITLLRRRAATS